MSSSRWVMAHGKRIEVEDLDDPPRVKAHARQRKRHALLFPGRVAQQNPNYSPRGPSCLSSLDGPLQRCHDKRLFSSLGTLRRALTSFGVGRETKRRVLEKLEAAGRIKVERRATRAPIITLLVPPETVP
jgi:hypothetical protein